MKVEAFLVCWNESEIMPLVVKHYKKFCDKITILDNHSTDGSDKLAESLGCEVIKFGTKFFDDQENMNIKNSCWKGSDAEWCIVADFDEILYYYDPCLKDMRLFLEYMAEQSEQWRPTIFKTQGWQIMSDDMPIKDLLTITNGYEFNNYSKSICFSPKDLTGISYNPGAHQCSPAGNVKWSEEILYVLHYKHIGGVQRTIDRYKEYKPRMSKNNRKHGWGKHYNRTEQSIREEWNQRMAISKPLI